MYSFVSSAPVFSSIRAVYSMTFSDMVNFSRALFGHLYDRLSEISCVRETNDQSLFLYMLEEQGDSGRARS